MYGLVFEIVEEWVIEKQGIETWHKIKEKAGCEIKDQSFLRRAYYQDEKLIDIIVAASELLSTSVPDILEAFGHYVIMHHFANGYDDLLRCQGSTLRQWLSNLNAMHDHVQMSFPGENFIAPIFWCEDCDQVEGSILLHYYSLRGTLLVPMVVGIVEQLASYHFEVEVKMYRLALQDEDGSSITTWRITAVDETQSWKLSPKVNGEGCETDPVSFDGVVMPSKCPFSGRALKKSTDAAVETGATENKFPLSRMQQEGANSSLTVNTAETSATGSFCSEASEGDDGVGLTFRKMKEVFPFHILVDQDFRIVQVGEKLPKVMHRQWEDFQGIHIQHVVQITRPVLGSSWDWKSLNKLSDQNFFLTPTTDDTSLRKKVSMSDSAIKFKAAMVRVSTEMVMFALTPDARNVTDLNNMDLTLSDLPLQSCQRDAVFLGESVTQEAAEAHKLDKLNRKLVNEKHLSNTLLYNIIPHKVADDLRKGKTVEPTLHENVTLFFSDIEGFTKICDQVEPWDVIDMMNQLYSVMDLLASHFNLYKVETVGDSYMCCSGLPEPDEYHAENVANFALAVVECVKHVKSPVDGLPVRLRIGIHTGSCTSGVVGTLTPHYCLFGDMVNTTSRHESSGIPGKIHCSSILFGRLKHFSKSDAYEFKARGLVDMKAKGKHFTYWLESGTEINPWANPDALAMLSNKAQDMLASKTWKMRKYFRKGHLFRGASSRSGFTDESGSQCHSTSDGSHGTGEFPDDDNLSIRSDDSALEDNIEDDDVGPIIDFSEEQLLHFGNDWKELKWEHDVSHTDLSTKLFDVIASALKLCIHKEAPRMQLVEDQLRGFVARIACLHNKEHAYHNFHHVAQVFLRSVFLWESRAEIEEKTMYGLGIDPWDLFVLLFSALIHGIEHNGVPNTQLEMENHLIYQMYEEKGSYQQRKSYSTAFELLEEEYGDLYEEIIFGCPNFRRTVRKVVLSADIESEDKLRTMLDKCDRLYAKPCTDQRLSRQQNEANIGLILAMATVGHYTQSYGMFLSWNRLQLEENLQAYRCGRSEDRGDSWYYEQNMFFKDAIVPLIRQVQRALPKAMYLEKGAKKNIELWEQSGKEWSAASMLPGAKVENSLCGVQSGDPIDKLISANVDILERLLKDVAASHKMERALGHLEQGETTGNPYDDIQLVIEMKRGGPRASAFEPTPDLLPDVRSELRGFVVTIAAGYENNEFRNFLHASHVAHLANLLLNGIHATGGSKDASGIAHDPLARFAIVLSALVHDVGHAGVPNGRLAEERSGLADKYRNKSIAEQNSINTAWDILMADCFKNLQHCMFESTEERHRLRQLLVNCVMATDIFDEDLRALRPSRWEKIFSEDASSSSDEEEGNCKATIVIEHIMQASDVAHTMQEWEIYRQWNESLFHEMYEAFLEGRAEKDPSEGWYKGELWFFDNWVIPLAQNLKECGVLDIVSEQLVKQARSNRLKWELEGQKISQDLLENAKLVRTTPSLARQSSQDAMSSTSTSGTEAILTSQLVGEVESLSKVLKRYERKIESAVGNLIAVTYKGQPGTRELRQQSWQNIHEHFKRQDWYPLYSDAEISRDGSELDLSKRGNSWNVQVIADDSSAYRDHVITQLSIAEKLANENSDES